MQKITDNLLNHVDIVYFPTIKATEYFQYSNMKQLMPAGKYHLVQREYDKRVCIYVGGLSDMYGSSLLYKSFAMLNDNAQGLGYELILVCREDEYKISGFSNNGQTKPNWLQVYHISDRDILRNLYCKATVALLPQKPTEYMNMAIGVKFFEYLGEGLPIISAGALEMSKIIVENGLGIVTEHTPEAFAEGIQEAMSNSLRYEGYRENIKDYMRNNQWEDRVYQVIEDLIGSGSNVE